ncbi:MAG: hypothetical protein AABX30_02550 [Nanoarchaeota archaeon]
MKKILVFLVMISVLMTGMVMAISGEPQTTEADVESVIEANVIDTLDFGLVIPDQDSDPVDSVITVGANNNVDLDVDIQLTSDPDTLFVNIFFDLDDSSTYEDSEQLDEILHYFINDPVGLQDFPITTILRVPEGFSPGSKAGTITYTIVEAI